MFHNYFSILLFLQNFTKKKKKKFWNSLLFILENSWSTNFIKNVIYCGFFKNMFVKGFIDISLFNVEVILTGRVLLLIFDGTDKP